MPIHEFIGEGGVFEPPVIEAMGQAFTAACASLGVQENDRHGREAVATRIIDLVREGGLTAPDVLRDRVVKEASASL